MKVDNGHRLKLYRNTNPHVGFELLKRWGESMRRGYFVFTSNVDGQFQKAGFDDRKILECHGSIHQLQCQEPCSIETWPANGFEPDVDRPASPEPFYAGRRKETPAEAGLVYSDSIRQCRVGMTTCSKDSSRPRS
jgi:hypothetical protein